MVSDGEFLAVLGVVPVEVCVEEFLVGAGRHLGVQLLANLIVHEVDCGGEVDFLVVLVDDGGHFVCPFFC